MDQQQNPSRPLFNDESASSSTSDHFEERRSGHSAVTLDEYMAALARLREQVGGQVLVQKWMPSKGRHHAPMPHIAHGKVLDGQKVKGVPIAGQFWQTQDGPSCKGPLVIRV